MNGKKLKPCPFCGSGKLELCGFDCGPGIGIDLFYVHCKSCDANGPYDVPKKKAIEAWEKRLTNA